MKKLWLIIQREYITRVRKKSFILITLLSPVLMVALFTLPVLLMSLAGGEARQHIVVKDDSGLFTDSLPASERVFFTFIDQPLDSLRRAYKQLGFDGVLYIPAFNPDTNQIKVYYYSEDQISLSIEAAIERALADKMEDYKMRRAGYDEQVIKSFKTNVSMELRVQHLDESGRLVEEEKRSSAGLATAIGYIAGFIIYMVLIFYGAMIMRSVMEEKSNRIVEVIISSVRPFQLMMGKILGVSAVGLTQMILWIVLFIGLFAIVGLVLPMEPSAIQGPVSNPMASMPADDQMAKVHELLDLITSQNWSFIVPTFLFYFLGGYFIYASLFAAVGSAMGDDMGESQSLSLLVMLPIILSIIMISPVIESPNSSLAVWMSIIPLSSPVIMSARLAFEPPLWQLIVSMVLLAVSAVFFVWLSGRIYRVGILLYGKKASVKEIGKWLFYSD